MSKYMVSPPFGETPFGLKYNHATGEGLIGGKAKSLGSMSNVLRSYLKARPGRKKEVSRNKIRIPFKVGNERFEKGMDELHEDGYVFKPVTNFGRLMA